MVESRPAARRDASQGLAVSGPACRQANQHAAASSHRGRGGKGGRHLRVAYNSATRKANLARARALMAVSPPPEPVEAVELPDPRPPCRAAAGVCASSRPSSDGCSPARHPTQPQHPGRRRDPARSEPAPRRSDPAPAIDPTRVTRSRWCCRRSAQGPMASADTPSPLAQSAIHRRPTRLSASTDRAPRRAVTVNPHKVTWTCGFVPRRLSYASRRPKLFT